MGKRTRSRRGQPKGKAYGFNSLRPAASGQSSSTTDGTQRIDPGTTTAPPSA